MDLNDIETLFISQLLENINSGNIRNLALVQIIAHCCGHLNLRRRTDYKKQEGVSYNTAKKYRENIVLFNTLFVIDNE